MSLMQQFLEYLPWVVTVASGVAAVLPAPRRGSFGAALVAIINIAAVNIGHAGKGTPPALKSDAPPPNGGMRLPLILLAAALSMTVALDALAAGVKLSCTPPTTREDGSALAATELAGFRFFRASPAASVVSDVVKTCAFDYIIPAGQCVGTDVGWAVTAIDVKGIESALSMPLMFLAVETCTPKARPAAPTGVKVIAIP
jgi:hypothetical protein